MQVSSQCDARCMKLPGSTCSPLTLLNGLMMCMRPGKTREHYMITVGPDKLEGEVASPTHDEPAPPVTLPRPIPASADTAQAGYSLSSLVPARLGSLWASPPGGVPSTTQRAHAQAQHHVDSSSRGLVGHSTPSAACLVLHRACTSAGGACSGCRGPQRQRQGGAGSSGEHQREQAEARPHVQPGGGQPHAHVQGLRGLRQPPERCRCASPRSSSSSTATTCTLPAKPAKPKSAKTAVIRP